MNVVDTDTIEYLRSVSDGSGVLCSVCGPLDGGLLDQDLGSYLLVDCIDWVGADRPTIFRVPSNDVNHALKSLKTDNRCCGQYGYIVECHKYEDRIIFVFDDVPTQCDIEIAQTVREIQSWVESGVVCQTIECDCGNKTHWTKIPTLSCEGDEIASFIQRSLLLRYGICCPREQSHTPGA